MGINILKHTFTQQGAKLNSIINNAASSPATKVRELAQLADARIGLSTDSWHAAQKSWTPIGRSYHTSMALREASFAQQTLKAARGYPNMEMRPAMVGNKLNTRGSDDIVQDAQKYLNDYTPDSMVGQMKWRLGELAAGQGSFIKEGLDDKGVASYARRAEAELFNLQHYLPG
ncbi:MAG: hypothetical protein JWM90_1876 [Thermoleophilia bacterium]|nr:hypothetical protein [Thermoleophilia bacterium]